MDPRIIKAVSDALPKYNKDLLVNHVIREVDGIRDLISDAYRETVKLLKGYVEYVGYRVLSPEERALHEINKNMNGGAPIAPSEIIIVEFKFRHNNKDQFVYLNIPYIKDNSIIIKGTRYAIQIGITEKIFSRTNEGIMVRVIRSPINFERTISWKVSALNNDSVYIDWVITTKIHNRKGQRRDVRITLLHYIMARHGFRFLIKMFGLNDSDISFTDTLNKQDTEHEYFAAKRLEPTYPEAYLKVKKSLMEDDVVRKLVVNLCYTLSFWHAHTVDMLYNEQGILFRTMMGEIIYPNSNEAQAKSHADLHLESVDHYLDHRTRMRLITFGVRVADIYELFFHTFKEIDRHMAIDRYQNLYDKRVDIIENFTVDTVIKKIMKSAYEVSQNLSRIAPGANGDAKVRQMLRIPETAIEDLRSAPTIVSSPPVYGGNFLLAFANKKVLLNSARNRKGATINVRDPSLRFDTSIPAVQSLVGFVGKDPARTGIINPFVEITAEGGIVEPEYAVDAHALAPFLPFQ